MLLAEGGALRFVVDLLNLNRTQFLDTTPGQSFICHGLMVYFAGSIRKTAYIRRGPVLLNRATMCARLSPPGEGNSSFSTAIHSVVRLAALFILFALSLTAQAQWLSQSFTLKPGWNAIFLHVDASHQTLDELIPSATGPVTEVWLWKPRLSTLQFVDNPATNSTADARWAVWTSARGDTDTLVKLVANGAYLIKNGTATDFTWTVKGKPVPPSYQWTTTGLNFVGFPTSTNSPPSFATYLAPAPGLDLTQTLQNSARVFRYPGGNLGTGNPTEVVSSAASSTLVKRGEAFWVRGSTNYYNRYYGPVEVVLQNTAGIHYGETLGTYSIRLKNLTTTSRTVTFSLLDSEAVPSGQTSIAARPQLLVRGALNGATLTYSHAVLAGQSFTLPAKGEVGSEQEVVLGLDRSTMTAAAGALYAGTLRLTDSGGLQQVDMPVTATVPNASGLWVGQAVVDRVGQYIKQYPKVSATASIGTQLTAASRPLQGAVIPGATWVARETNSSRAYAGVASSLDGRRLVAAVTSGQLYISADFGTNWLARDSARAWTSVACSADGSVMAATVNNGNLYVSTDSGTSWVARDSSRAWKDLVCSADGQKMAAVTLGGQLYTSGDRGTNWVARDASRNWTSIAMSADGARLVAAVNPGQLYTSINSGATWTARESSRAWSAVASSDNGANLVATVNPGQIYTSTNAGVNWSARESSRSWTAVASSSDGQRLSATVGSGQLYTSRDGGATWESQETNRAWSAITSSGDATRLVAVVNSGQIYTLSRRFADYVVDATTGLIRDQDGLYLSTGVNTNMAKVASSLPLRLILHNDAAASKVSLLQRAYIGKGASTTNTVVANREALLDATQIANARRISAAHLPFSLTNTVWTASGNFNPGTVVLLSVPVDYNDQASNPFLHTFHPDHDNLDPKFERVRPQGEESYGVTRTLKLTFNAAGTDFRSLTSSAQGRSGTYEETITLTARAGASREYRLSGAFSLQRISSISPLTTQ